MHLCSELFGSTRLKAVLILLRDRTNMEFSFVQSDWTLSQSFADVPADQWNVLDANTLRSWVFDGLTVTVAWDIAKDEPWCESAGVAQTVNGSKLLVRKIPQEQLVVNCDLFVVGLRKAEQVEGLRVHDGREQGSIFLVRTGSHCSTDLVLDVRNVCNKLLWSKNQRLQICILGGCKLVGKGQMLWSQEAAAKPSKFRLRKKTNVGRLRFCKWLQKLTKDDHPGRPEDVEV